MGKDAVISLKQSGSGPLLAAPVNTREQQRCTCRSEISALSSAFREEMQHVLTQVGTAGLSKFLRQVKNNTAYRHREGGNQESQNVCSNSVVQLPVRKVAVEGQVRAQRGNLPCKRG